MTEIYMQSPKSDANPEALRLPQLACTRVGLRQGAQSNVGFLDRADQIQIQIQIQIHVPIQIQVREFKFRFIFRFHFCPATLRTSRLAFWTAGLSDCGLHSQIRNLN